MVTNERPEPSNCYDRDHSGLLSFSRHEDSEAFGPHIEASVELDYRVDRSARYLGTFMVDVSGSDQTGHFSFSGRASAEWLREAAAVLLDTADAVDVANREYAEADPTMVNEWTVDDLPDASVTTDKYGAIGPMYFPAVDDYRDAVVAHLNANGGVPASREDAALADHLGRQAVAIDELQLDLEAAEADRDRWRRAHEIVERERDQAREQWKKWEHKANEAEREVSTWRTSTESAHSDFLQAAHDRDEAVVRAEAAEARAVPAVSRADVAEALSRCINPEMWNVTFPSVVSEVCDLFGIEAGQATDPLLDKAQEFAALADWELTDREAELLHTVARHVLGQEAKR